MFALTLGDLSAFRFDDVTLRSSNNPIKAEVFVSTICLRVIAEPK